MEGSDDDDVSSFLELEFLARIALAKNSSPPDDDWFKPRSDDMWNIFESLLSLFDLSFLSFLPPKTDVDPDIDLDLLERNRDLKDFVFDMVDVVLIDSDTSDAPPSDNSSTDPIFDDIFSIFDPLLPLPFLDPPMDRCNIRCLLLYFNISLLLFILTDCVDVGILNTRLVFILVDDEDIFWWL